MEVGVRLESGGIEPAAALGGSAGSPVGSPAASRTGSGRATFAGLPPARCRPPSQHGRSAPGYGRTAASVVVQSTSDHFISLRPLVCSVRTVQRLRPVLASSSFSSVETCRKSAPFRAGHPPLSRARSSAITAGAFASSGSPLPLSPSRFLAVGLPPRGGANGAYPVARGGVATGAAASFRPAGVAVTVASGAVWRSDPLTFWSRPPASWACSTLRTLDGHSLALSLPVSARADPDRGSQALAHCPQRLARRITPSHCQVAAPR